MAKVDLDKLICSLINEDVAKLRVDPKAAIYDALRAQGLSYKDGAIVEIEPKFKAKKGKWYVCTDTFVSRGKLIAIKGQTYQSQQEDDTITCEDKCLFIDRHDGKASDYFRYWTIQDAKDGDVLATSAGAFIYNDNNGGGSCPGSYCGINTLGEFKTGVKHHWTGKKVYPATKEQQDLLFAKMKEAGYMWDANEKKLEKIEQKPAWSEEDEINLGKAIWYVENPAPMVAKDSMLVEWLKNLRGRVQPQPQQEWSEEDEKIMNTILCIISDFRNVYKDNKEAHKDADKIEDWLKSLRPQLHWKPNFQQMKQLEWVAEQNKDNMLGKELMTLYKDLKKLRDDKD